MYGIVHRENGGKTSAWFYLFTKHKKYNYDIYKYEMTARMSNHLTPGGQHTSLGQWAIPVSSFPGGYSNERRIRLFCRRANSSSI